MTPELRDAGSASFCAPALVVAYAPRLVPRERGEAATRSVAGEGTRCHDIGSEPMGVAEYQLLRALPSHWTPVRPPLSNWKKS